MFVNALEYFLQNKSTFLDAFRIHVTLSFFALVIGTLVGFLGGVISYEIKVVQKSIRFITQGIRVIPSVALLALLIPYIGTGFLPSLIALTILAIPPVLIHTLVGLSSLRNEYIETATALGLNKVQLFLKIQAPLISFFVFSGIQIAAVEVIASATLASFIGGGGLGNFIVSGITLFSFPIILVGAIPIACLAISIELLSTYVMRNWQRNWRDFV